MSDLIDTGEMYLKTVFELIEEGIVPLRARIAERLGHSGPTVSQTVARLERDGLMVVTGDRHLELTELGMTRATRVMRKHRLAERLLTDVIGLDWPHVHEEACRWEHVMSRQVEERLIALLDHPGFDPYGNPIPGLDEFGDPAPVGDLGIWLTDVPTGAEYIVARLGEPLQVDTDLLASFQEAGIKPGARISHTEQNGTYTVAPADSELVLELDGYAAKHVFVTPV
ncbi:metal-dependent transcriptional regulator [Ruania alba]|uniref:Iron (Metal) dependent repressor, DtxR family n=1 Tax=Ruania alba TaxID=648782 RepID=A0A1H5MXC5_9MICO|nr:metal-dependent transcriptional regulator [Ruania alba]SEE93933.1 iron (metal) dependent repressor, DtxR family [Ruania alba]